MNVDTLLADPTRLRILSLLMECNWADFSFVQDNAGISKSALSKQMTKLEEHGYLKVQKYFTGKYPKTSLQLTQTGRNAIQEHLDALREIVDRGRDYNPMKRREVTHESDGNDGNR